MAGRGARLVQEMATLRPTRFPRLRSTPGVPGGGRAARARLLLALLSLAALALAACGSGAASEDIADAAPGAPAGAAPVEAKPGGTPGPAASDDAVAEASPDESAQATPSSSGPPPAAPSPREPSPREPNPGDVPVPPSDDERAGPLPYDNAAALATLETLTVEIGPRVQGTEAEERAAGVIADAFRSFGYEVDLQEFPLESRVVEELRLEVAGEALPASVLEGAAAGAVSGPLVAVPGLGSRDDMAAVELEGAVALIERGVLFLREKVADASAAGAVAVVIFNNDPGGFSGGLGAEADVPVLALSREDGLALRRVATAAQTTAEVTLRFLTSTAASQNVIARSPGGTCAVWVGGHYDTVPNVPGANDNGSGTALVVEMARAFAGSRAGAGICYAAFGAEEASAMGGGLLGSRVFVAELEAAGEAENARAMLNLDVAAAGNQIILVGDRVLVTQAAAIAAARGIEARAGSLPFGSGSDHLNFAQAGIPVLFPTLLGGPIHDPSDDFSAVEPQRLAVVGRIAHATLECLAAAGDPVLAPPLGCTRP